MSRLTWNGTAEPVSRNQILRRVRGHGDIHFYCSADHEQDWQPYPVDSYSAICDDHTYIHTYILHCKTVEICFVSQNIMITAVVLMDPFSSHLSIPYPSALYKVEGTRYKICCVSKQDFHCAAVEPLFTLPTCPCTKVFTVYRKYVVHQNMLLLLLFLTFSALVANPKKTTLHGGQPRSWSAEQGKKKKKKRLDAPPPPRPPPGALLVRRKKKKKSRGASTCLGAMQVGVTQVASVRLASVQGFLRLVG